MAARRLLIVMLVLLGLSTLAAALVPQRSLRKQTSTSSTASVPTETGPQQAPPAGAYFPIVITVGGNQVPVVTCPPAKERQGACKPVRVGDQVSLTVRSRRADELRIPFLGLVEAVAPDAPARFEFNPDTPGTIGILFSSSHQVPTKHQVAARIEVAPAAGRADEATSDGKPEQKKR